MLKTICYFGVAILTLQNVQGQGAVIFNNRVPGVVESAVSGVDGQPLSGNGYTAQIFGGPMDAADDALQPLFPTTTFRPPPGEGFVVVPNATVKVPGVPEGGQARLQLRAWDNREGTITQWTQVLADQTIPRGASPVFTSARLGGLFVLPANLNGLESFRLTIPAAIVLHGAKETDPTFSFHVSFLGSAGKTYEIQRTIDLRSWQAIGFATNGPGTTFEFYDMTPDPTNAFYRAQEIPTPTGTTH